MATYPLPESLSDTHDGDEWAIAAILGGRVVALRYLADVAPSLTKHLGAPSAEFVIKRWVQTAPADLRELQALGDVSAGIVTEDGFEARWQLAGWMPSDRSPAGAE